MNTQLLTMDRDTPDPSAIRQAARILLEGGLVAFPTETVYGLGGLATRAESAKKIYAAKGRPSDNPLIIHVAEPEDAERYAVTNPLYDRLARAFMPGPLTVILPKKPTVPAEVTGGLDTVAIRCPDHPVAQALIRQTGVAIAAPSANRSGSPSPTCAAHVMGDLSGSIDAVLDGGECDIGLESTIVKITEQGLLLLRPGAITADALSCVCEQVEISPAVTEGLGENEKPLSPGMKYKHYAPAIPLVLLEGEEEDILSFLRHAQNEEHCAILCYHEELDFLRFERLIDIGAQHDLARQAQTLFGALRRADELDADIIYAHLPPRDGLGLALYNRLIRAAAHTVRHV